MTLSTFYKKWKLALIDDNGTKANKLRSIIQSPIYNFPGTLSFIDRLNTMSHSREYLILIVPTHLVNALPSDINEKVHKLYIYGEKNENDLPSFDDVCLHLSNLIIGQCIEKSIYFRRSNENGSARVFVQESISRSQNLIKQLQDLCDEIDDKISYGQEEMNEANSL